MATTTKSKPKQGEIYRCETCGMELKITADCNCEEGCPELSCCGKPLQKT